MDRLAEGLERVEERIALACQRSGRKRSEITLIVVSKGERWEDMMRVLAQGASHFGENRLPEFLEKRQEEPKQVTWHWIGPLQSNKARKIGENFHVVHSLASLSAAKELAKCPSKPKAFVQVNVGKEVQKSGILSGEVASFLESSVQYLPGGVIGLMTIGPQVEDPEESRRLFRELRQLADRHGLAQASMGMSGDFEVAIEEGATHIRIGSAIFRSNPPC